MKNKFHLRQTNSSLLATKMLLETVLCMGHCQSFKVNESRYKQCGVTPHF